MNRRKIFQSAAHGAVAAGAALQSATSQGVIDMTSTAEQKSFVTAKDEMTPHAQDPGTGRMPARLAGAWRLMSWETVRSDGQSLSFLMGPRPTGLIMYQPNGYMAIQVMHDPRPAFADGRSSAATRDELKRAYFGYFAYWGTYTNEEGGDTVEHSVESSLFPEEVGRKYRRSFRFDGQKLLLTTPPFKAGLLSAPPDLLEAAHVRDDEELVNRLTWERIE